MGSTSGIYPLPFAASFSPRRLPRGGGGIRLTQSFYGARYLLIILGTYLPPGSRPNRGALPVTRSPCRIHGSCHLTSGLFPTLVKTTVAPVRLDGRIVWKRFHSCDARFLADRTAPPNRPWHAEGIALESGHGSGSLPHSLLRPLNSCVTEHRLTLL